MPTTLSIAEIYYILLPKMKLDVSTRVYRAQQFTSGYFPMAKWKYYGEVLGASYYLTYERVSEIRRFIQLSQAYHAHYCTFVDLLA
jgi:hypothetical protein